MLVVTEGRTKGRTMSPIELFWTAKNITKLYTNTTSKSAKLLPTNEHAAVAPVRGSLNQGYPNPFSPSSYFRFPLFGGPFTSKWKMSGRRRKETS